MCSITVRSMADYERDVRGEVAEVFVNGYYNELSYFTEDQSTLQKAFRTLFSPEVFMWRRSRESLSESWLVPIMGSGLCRSR
ncbi:Uncharacterised protein [Actinobacillus pleuropneumoniae]|nr:Uncharacterised protein [Actinobacillus pleuropneumoniae]